MPLRTPSEILAEATKSGQAKYNKTTRNNFGLLAMGSVLAGAYIALGGALSIIIGFGFPEFTASNPGLQRLLSGLVFPLGLMLVVVLGADLFTGNNALLIPSTLQRNSKASKVLLNWVLVWLGNFAGALLVSYFLVYLTGIFAAPPYSEAVAKIAQGKMQSSFSVIFLKGIGANWCVCLAIWLALSGRRLGEKLLACEIPVMAFVALGYEHCVANMFFLPLATMQGYPLGFADMLTSNILPATLGNIVGGALFVGATQYYMYRKG